jgi:transcriptional regulator with XRE-family HTH domain
MKTPGYHFPEVMREQRRLRHWSVPQAARAIGHSPTWIANCEAGNIRQPRDETLREIARGFGITLGEVRSACGLVAVEDSETELLSATLAELAAVLRETTPARYPLIVEAARLVARVTDNSNN